MPVEPVGSPIGSESGGEPESIFGPIIASYDVERAVVATLRAWLNEYLAEIERKRGLPPGCIPRPPAPESYHGGVDFDTWTQDTTPEVMVITNPAGEPELSASNGYTQPYDVQVGCLWIGTGSVVALKPEDEARAVASYLGAATMLLVQQSGLYGLAERVRMTAAPMVDLPDPDRRQIARVITTFRTWVPALIQDRAGPLANEPREALGWRGTEEPFAEPPVVEFTTLTVVTNDSESSAEGESDEGGLFPHHGLYPHPGLYPK